MALPSVGKIPTEKAGPLLLPAGIPECQVGLNSGRHKEKGPKGSWRCQVPRPVLLPCRLEEQTKRLQKDMKKSTDADLGRWHCPRD